MAEENYRLTTPTSCPIECALCGAKMSRSYASKGNVANELWTCQDPDCGQTVTIDNAALHGEIIAILTNMIDEPSLVRPRSIPYPEPPLKSMRSKSVFQEYNSFESKRIQ